MIAPWTPEQDRQLLDMQAGGYSARAISAVVGKSRSAVLGRLWRLRQTGDAPPAMKRPPPAKRCPKPPVVRIEVRDRPFKVIHLTQRQADNIGKPPPNNDSVKRPWREVKAEAFMPLPGSTPTRLVDRASRACAWPVSGDGEAILSCAMPTDGHVYCAHHRRLAYIPVKPLDIKRYMRMK